MTITSMEQFIRKPERYIDMALKGERVEVIRRDGKTLSLDLKEED